MSNKAEAEETQVRKYEWRRFKKKKEEKMAEGEETRFNLVNQAGEEGNEGGKGGDSGNASGSNSTGSEESKEQGELGAVEDLRHSRKRICTEKVVSYVETKHFGDVDLRKSNRRAGKAVKRKVKGMVILVVGLGRKLVENFKRRGIRTRVWRMVKERLAEHIHSGNRKKSLFKRRKLRTKIFLRVQCAINVNGMTRVLLFGAEAVMLSVIVSPA